MATRLARWWSDRQTDAVCLAGSIPARNKYLYGLQVVVPGLAVFVCAFSMFVKAPTIQELLQVWDSVNI